MQDMPPARSNKVVANGSASGLDHARAASPTLDGSAASALDGSAPEPNDYSNYFCTYSYIYHVRIDMGQMSCPYSLFAFEPVVGVTAAAAAAAA